MIGVQLAFPAGPHTVPWPKVRPATAVASVPEGGVRDKAGLMGRRRELSVTDTLGVVAFSVSETVKVNVEAADPVISAVEQA